MSAVAGRHELVTGRAALVTTRGLIGAISGLFILPNLVLAAWLQAIPAAMVLAGSFGSLALVLWPHSPESTGWLRQPVELRRLGTLIALSAAIFILGGQGHVFYPNPDWLIRDAVLADLVRGSAVPVYSLSGVDYMLRAPVGLYMLPALVGRSFGLLSAHATLIVQNALLLGAILHLLADGQRGLGRIGILVLFAGLCILPRLSAVFFLGADPSFLVSDARPLDEWHLLFQYSSSVVQFFWVPNHALPGWWVATLAVLCARRRIDLSVLLASIGPMVVWSPLAILPGAPFAMLFAVRAGFRVLLSGRVWAGAAAGLGFLPVAIYLVSGSGEIAHEFAGARPNFWVDYTTFLIVQLPSAAYLIARWRRLPADLTGLFAVSLAILLLLPFVSFGPSNDLVMRASIPALVVLAFCFADVVLCAPPDRHDWRRIALVLVALTSLSALVEASRALRNPSFPISDCTLLEASSAAGDHGIPTNYIAPTDRLPEWLIEVPTTRLESVHARQCWPGLKRPDGR